MTEAGWTAKLIADDTFTVFLDRDNVQVVGKNASEDHLRKEHARAVRIVKKKIRSLEACIASDKRDGNEAGATLHVYALSILNSTLVEMQKGRA